VQESTPVITYRGQNVQTRWKTGKASAGPAQLELVQPLAGNNIFDEFIRKHGEGIHHLQFLTEDITETNRLMAAEGFNLLMEGQTANGKFSFYDTRETLKIVWEAYERS